MNQQIMDEFILNGILIDAKNYIQMDKKDPASNKVYSDMVEAMKNIESSKYAGLKNAIDEKYNEEANSKDMSPEKIEALRVISTARHAFSVMIFETAKDTAVKIAKTGNTDLNSVQNSRINSFIVDSLSLLDTNELKSVCSNIDEYANARDEQGMIKDDEESLIDIEANRILKADYARIMVDRMINQVAETNEIENSYYANIKRAEAGRNITEEYRNLSERDTIDFQDAIATKIALTENDLNESTQYADFHNFVKQQNEACHFVQDCFDAVEKEFAEANGFESDSTM